jgi:hypothetical protein
MAFTSSKSQNGRPVRCRGQVQEISHVSGQALIGTEVEPPSGVVSIPFLSFLSEETINRTARNLLGFAQDVGPSRRGMTLPL